MVITKLKIKQINANIQQEKTIIGEIGEWCATFIPYWLCYKIALQTLGTFIPALRTCCPESQQNAEI